MCMIPTEVILSFVARPACEAIIMPDPGPAAMEHATFAVDIDGTLTEDGGGGRIHLGALSALRHLATSGHNVILVTGRSSVEAYMLAVYGGITRLAVGENGGCITTGPSEHLLLGDMDVCERAFEVIGPEFGAVRKGTFPRMTEIVLESTFDVGAAREFAKKRGLGIGLADSGYAVHLNPEGIDKESGLRKALDMLGARGKVIAIGDSETDVPMFRTADTSIALGNAPPGVRSAATIRTRAEAGDGVVEALDLLAPMMARSGEWDTGR
ncbi:hydrolase of the HAD superfamily [Cenarchaeum symbiosum A]|uniref:Phosphoglycolate phosphatase n=1 Tax=Cenarchaeum symbiosum (strain A) TaxID=414004 RepID=A0RUG7_CENSY|nr:hydrolase of the HAD superfamily [Cenarchaeum symbiosum A]